MKTSLKPTMRTYQYEGDYWRIREFLREVSMLNDRHEFSRSLLGWDYWVWHVNMNMFHLKPEEVIHPNDLLSGCAHSGVKAKDVKRNQHSA